MPTDQQHADLDAAQAACRAAYDEFHEASEVESAWAAAVADELAVAAAHGLTLPDTLVRALTQYRTARAATEPLRAAWRECSSRAGQLYAAMHGDRAVSV